MNASKQRIILYWIAASVLFAGFAAVLAVRHTVSRGTDRPQMVLLGDSLFANEQSETSVSHMLEDLMGITITDCSFGGSAAAYLDLDGQLGHTQDFFSLASLSQSIVTGDFRIQRNARLNRNATSYFDERVGVLEQIDFSGVDTLVIEHCLNDFQAGVPIEDERNPMNEYTYKGALRTAIGNLREQYPNIRIVMVSPTCIWYYNLNQGGDRALFGGPALDEYVKAQREVAEEFGLQWIDLYSGLFAIRSAEDAATYTLDGIHPNEYGRELIAEELSGQMDFWR